MTLLSTTPKCGTAGPKPHIVSAGVRRETPPRLVTNLGGVVLCFFLLARNVEDVIGRFLRLGGRINHELTIIAKLLQPTLNVGRLILDDGGGDSGFGAEKGCSHLRDQLLDAVHRRAERRGFGD